MRNLLDEISSLAISLRHHIAHPKINPMIAELIEFEVRMLSRGSPGRWPPAANSTAQDGDEAVAAAEGEEGDEVTALLNEKNLKRHQRGLPAGAPEQGAAAATRSRTPTLKVQLDGPSAVVTKELLAQLSASSLALSASNRRSSRANVDEPPPEARSPRSRSRRYRFTEESEVVVAKPKVTRSRPCSTLNPEKELHFRAEQWSQA